MQATAVTMLIHLKVHDGKLEKVNDLFKVFCEKVANEKETLMYGFCFSEDKKEVIVREVYTNAQAIIAHSNNVGS